MARRSDTVKTVKTNRLWTVFFQDADRLGGALTLEIRLNDSATDLGQSLAIEDIGGKLFHFERSAILYTLQSDLTAEEYKEYQEAVRKAQEGA